MDTNTIMLIALAIIIVLSALAIWLANRGSGVEEPPHEHDTDSDDVVVERDTVTKPKVTDTKTAPNVKTTDSKVTSDTKVVETEKVSDDKPDIKVVDNTKKNPTAKPTVDSKDNINKGGNTKTPPKKR